MSCHGTLHAGKMSHRPRPPLLREDIAVDPLCASSFGTFVRPMVQGLLTTLSWQSFLFLACGWALARDRHTITTSLWLTGATTETVLRALTEVQTALDKIEQAEHHCIERLTPSA
jgi:hypothetical protein